MNTPYHAAASGSNEDKLRAFRKAFRELDARTKIFTSLRIELLDRLTLQKQLDDIGKARDDEFERLPVPPGPVDAR